MKVGIYVGNATPEAGGGYTFVQEVLEELAQRRDSGHQFTILTAGRDAAGYGGLEALSLAPGMPAVQRRAARRAGRMLDRALGRAPAAPDWSIPGVDRLLTEAGIDVVWYLMPAACWSLDVPYVTVVWDLQHRLQPYFPEVTARGESGVRETAYATILRRASMVIAGTEVGRDEIVRFYGVAPERIRILPHPTPSFALSVATGTPAARPKVAPPDPYLYYPAQFWPHKNHVNLLEALRLLRVERGVSVSLALSGADKGNLGWVKGAAKRLGVEDAVSFLGFVSREDLVGLYQNALALSYVTFFGPENLPPLEAFALGCPVIASEVAGAREQMGDAALFVDPRRPDQIAEAVVRLYTDPEERAALVERGRVRARRFTRRDFVAGVLEWLDAFAPVRRCWPSGAGA